MDDTTRDALEAAERIAPKVKDLRLVGATVNEILNLDWTDAKWTGIFRRNPDWKERVLKVIGKESRNRQETIHVTGNARGAYISDIHAPYHDVNAVRLTIKVLSKLELDILIDGGDGLDFKNVGTYLSDPGLAAYIQDEIDAFHVDVLAPIKQFIKAPKKVLFPGNHLDRMRKWLWANPGVYGLKVLEIPDLLELSRFGYEYADKRVLFGNVLEASHGTVVRSEAGASAKGEAMKRRFSISTITGHVHRQGRYQTHPPRKNTVISQENPCLCTLSPDWLDTPDWTHGFTLFEVKDGKINIEPIQIHDDYTCKVNGKWYGLD